MTNPGLASSWSVVAEWREDRRYALGTDEQEAAALLKSIEDPVEGVLPWLKLHW
ncbi:MAG: hypothetical protein HY904_19000 [Deltaproteobacteria bacterium]|nr:hypothetical protein [Deltaproteobacteria bacterium]